jgi:predicted Zn-dependent protease
MKSWFFELAENLCAGLHADEVLLCTLAGERSDFVRFNHARVRQAGSVEQRYVSLRLVRNRRQASALVSLAGDSADLAISANAISTLRDTLTQLPEDPWLLYAEDPRSTSTERRGRLPHAEEVVAHVASAAAATDFVGFYGAGAIYRGFANSLGQRNWHEVDTFSFDWSLHLEGDKAVKDSYAGFEWDARAFEARVAQDIERLELLRAPSRSLAPGEYRAYLTPQALEEITGLLQWDAFSARKRATRQSPLLRMQAVDDVPGASVPQRLSSIVTLLENTEAGVAPAFQEDGFLKPSVVTLIAAGGLGESLASPRSAREYGLTPNAGARETPESLDMLPGALAPDAVLAALDSGLYVSNLWYLNFSDRPAGRMTGMTRFATFRVENGRIAGPVTPLRFDDTLYRMLGDALVDLTSARELVISPSTYDERSTSSVRLPGALLARMRFTL